MADANVALQRRLVEPLNEVVQLADVASQRNRAILLNDGHTGRVISTIFEPFQAIDDNLGSLLGSNVTNDTAHTCTSNDADTATRPRGSHRHAAGDTLCEAQQLAFPIVIVCGDAPSK